MTELQQTGRHQYYAPRTAPTRSAQVTVIVLWLVTAVALAALAVWLFAQARPGAGALFLVLTAVPLLRAGGTDLSRGRDRAKPTTRADKRLIRPNTRNGEL